MSKKLLLLVSLLILSAGNAYASKDLTGYVNHIATRPGGIMVGIDTKTSYPENCKEKTRILSIDDPLFKESLALIMMGLQTKLYMQFEVDCSGSEVIIKGVAIDDGGLPG